MMMVVGGGILPLVQNAIADTMGYMFSYIIPLIAIAYMLFYSVIGSKNVNKDIPVPAGRAFHFSPHAPSGQPHTGPSARARRSDKWIEVKKIGQVAYTLFAY